VCILFQYEREKQISKRRKNNQCKKHPNADTLDLVQVLGWECVAKAGEFKTGDLVVYINIDSVVPEKPEFEFLRKNKKKK
jgi:hypothetical protein